MFRLLKSSQICLPSLAQRTNNHGYCVLQHACKVCLEANKSTQQCCMLAVPQTTSYKLSVKTLAMGAKANQIPDFLVSSMWYCISVRWSVITARYNQPQHNIPVPSEIVQIMFVPYVQVKCSWKDNQFSPWDKYYTWHCNEYQSQSWTTSL